MRSKDRGRIRHYKAAGPQSECGYTPRPRMKISVVIPVCNEVDNVEPLAQEIRSTLAAFAPFEIIFIDDGSTDGTDVAVERARANGIPEIRLLRHARRSGQSTAVLSGVRA